MFKETYPKKEGAEQTSNAIIIPDHLVNFDLRKEAVKKINNGVAEKTESDLMEDADIPEEKLLNYLDYLKDIQMTGADLESWRLGEIAKLVPPRAESWSVEGNKIIVKDKTTNKITSDWKLNDRETLGVEEEKMFWDINYPEKKKALEVLTERGGVRTVDYLAEKIKEDYDLFFIYSQQITDIFKKHKDYGAEKLFERLEKDSSSFQIKDTAKQIVLILTDLLGAEETRKRLNEMIEENRDSGKAETTDNLEYARSFITPNHDKIVIENLKKFYEEKIKFEEYELNKKMSEKEIRILEGTINKNEKLLEMGCGAGRLIKELVKDDYDVAGFDLVDRHVKLTQQEIEKTGKSAKVFRGDWHNNAIKNQSFDTVYSLGRNILHDYSLPDQVQLFREAARVLKPGGRFIFDVPDREKGGYKEMVEEYSREMKNRGIRHFRFGAIYDSPDGKNFTTRYTYSHQDIIELAQLTGFKTKAVKKERLETGKGDENLYYILEKV